MAQTHRVVIIGGGFAGLNAARRLRKAAVEVTLIDRKNHHLFQPLLYQVATAGLSPGDIAEPIRGILRKQKNARVRLGEVVGIDVEAREVALADGAKVGYDTLLIATGATHNYFGHPEWEAHAPGLKTLDDAISIRRRFLLAFEEAELAPDAAARRRLLTFAIIGAGPTGVELAGTMAEMAHQSMPGDFRNVSAKDARILLIQGGKRILQTFDEALGERALADLKERGVEVVLGDYVSDVQQNKIKVGEQEIEVAHTFWAAGVAGSALGAMTGAPCDRSGCVQVQPDLTIPGHPEVFVAGDLANLTDAKGQRVPGLAPAALQMGEYVAKVIRARLEGDPAPGPFAYRDKGALATIGRASAVGQAGQRKLTGLIAWLAWLFIHLYFLIGFDNRLLVLIQWFWAYLDHQSGARLITEATSPRARPT
jgi:NADH dehydrogenase